jgi:hypothetical protein
MMKASLPRSMHRLVRFFAVLFLCFSTAQAHADKFSDSYLGMRIEAATVQGQWDIALRDLDVAIGLDMNGNGEITWDEVRSRHPDISQYALSRLALSSDDKPCPVQVTAQQIERHSDGAYAALNFHALCPDNVQKLEVRYDLLFDIDPQHKGLVKFTTADGTSTAVFDPEHRTQSFMPDRMSRVEQAMQFLKTGIWHIWIGFDHLLFLFSLLLPAVLAPSGTHWRPGESLKDAAVDVLKIVTAFTIAHSLTLTLSTLQLVTLPARWVESAIAASVIVAALNNLYPLVQGRRWVVAFLFGLIHGFGFASVLADLGLPASSLAVALLGFNMGVEIGQMAIVAAFLPIAYALRQTWFYRRLVFTAGSTMIVAVGTVWLIQRAFDLSLIDG